MNPRRHCHSVLGFLACIATTTALRAEDSIFPDKNLEAAVRKYVFAKRDTDKPIVAEDVKDISTVHADGKGIKDLKGLEKCVSLAELSLARNEISDLAPLSGLKLIQLLDLSKNKVSELKPLENLKALQYLQLEDNQVKDLAPIAGLTNMNSLYLSRNQVSDLAPIKDMKKLWSLYLAGNKITSIEVISGLTGLTGIDLVHNEVSDLKPIAGLKQLERLFLKENKITDLSPLVQAAEADAKGEKRWAPYLRLMISGNPLSEESKKGLEALKAIGVRVLD